MAAFMNRLDGVLRATHPWREQIGAIDLESSLIICETSDYQVDFPRKAHLDAVISTNAAGTLGYSVLLVASFDGGLTWSPIDSAAMRATNLSDRWNNVRVVGMIDLASGE